MDLVLASRCVWDIPSFSHVLVWVEVVDRGLQWWDLKSSENGWFCTFAQCVGLSFLLGKLFGHSDVNSRCYL